MSLVAQDPWREIGDLFDRYTSAESPQNGS